MSTFAPVVVVVVLGFATLLLAIAKARDSITAHNDRLRFMLLLVVLPVLPLDGR
jgi:hypothetical protein